jgi:hypothetical protein
MDVVLGFDPGGTSQLGWAVLERDGRSTPTARNTGTSSNAEDALADALACVSSGDTLRGAGIDSPLYWTPRGERAADGRVRQSIQECGAPHAAGTVQHPNSLRGACVVQGPTMALLLRRRFPDIQITEAHPKALLWVLGLANSQRRAEEVSVADLSAFVRCNAVACEHERDAVLAAVAAFAMIDRSPSWRDLAAEEKEAILLAGEVAYWFPLTAA